ncbi:peptidoglycan-associated lipoprotein Pal [Thiomicrorhabdus aquaedulcis]|uniref:peptidoglycan-associated lipoprotein Pal n=1 Tax=Thiomicrorhabdus aquaedulcis TaxID=2211106 RepID=UPI000FD74516|nr:peptidoglycan-associated lipoprotein Pal [Thiomicrorhabdus aquaedulcis]
MSVTNIKQLFLVGFLGLALVGCSSTPKTEEAAPVATVDTTDADAARLAAEKAAADLAAKKANLMAIIAGKVVRFEFDKSDVQPEFFSIVKANADYLALDPSVAVTINGHCDERGTREYNLALGERRAAAVKTALMSEGVSADRINVVSMGEDSPVAEGHNEAAWSENRRAEFAY